MGTPIKVLVVDDSLLFRTAIAKGLSEDGNITVVGTAANATEAQEKLRLLKPQVMTLDVEMPGMTGLDLLRFIMPKSPLPVIVVSAVDGIVFEALRAGAVDFVAKPLQTQLPAFIADLAAKIKVAAVAHVGHPTPAIAPSPGIQNTSGILAIGASTGGTEATSALLKGFPANMPGIVITQHMPPVFTQMYAERLNRECAMTVSEAKDGDVVKPGLAFVAAGDKQMRLMRRGTDYVLKCQGEEKVSGHCPSVDVLFDSVAAAAGRNAIGVLLTGMGADGAKGLLAMKEKGAYTIGQDKASCVVYGMPMEAFKLGAVTKQLPLSQIAADVLSHLRINR